MCAGRDFSTSPSLADQTEGIFRTIMHREIFHGTAASVAQYTIVADFGSRLRGVPAHLLADLDGDRYKPVKTNRPCTCRREINDSATDERSAIVDRHDNGAAIPFVRHSYFGPER